MYSVESLARKSVSYIVVVENGRWDRVGLNPADGYVFLQKKGMTFISSREQLS
jgi:hypothetical protein